MLEVAPNFSFQFFYPVYPKAWRNAGSLYSQLLVYKLDTIVFSTVSLLCSVVANINA